MTSWYHFCPRNLKSLEKKTCIHPQSVVSVSRCREISYLNKEKDPTCLYKYSKKVSRETDYGCTLFTSGAAGLVS